MLFFLETPQFWHCMKCWLNPLQHSKFPGSSVKYKVHLSELNKGNCFRVYFSRKSSHPPSPTSYQETDGAQYREGTGEIELSLEYSSLKLEASCVDWEAPPAFGFINNKVNLFWQRNLCFVNSPCLQTLSLPRTKLLAAIFLHIHYTFKYISLAFRRYLRAFQVSLFANSKSTAET